MEELSKAVSSAGESKATGSSLLENKILIIGVAVVVVLIAAGLLMSQMLGSPPSSTGDAGGDTGGNATGQTGGDTGGNATGQTGGNATGQTGGDAEPTYAMMAWTNKVDDFMVLSFNSKKAILLNLNGTFKAFYSGCVNPDAEPTIVNGRIACPKANGGQGSKWDMVTGAILDGPATENLVAIELKIEENRVLGRIS